MKKLKYPIIIFLSFVFGGLTVFFLMTRQNAELKARAQPIFIDSKEIFDLDNQLFRSYGNMNSAFTSCSSTDTNKCNWNNIGASVRNVGDTYSNILTTRKMLLDKLTNDISKYQQINHME